MRADRDAGLNTEPGDRRPEMVQASVVKEVGRRIRQLRIGRVGPRMTQENLSERAHISVSFLSMIERGERSPHLETLAKIAEALEVRIAELFNFGLEDGAATGVEPMLRPLIDACRKYNLGKRDVDRLIGVV